MWFLGLCLPETRVVTRAPIVQNIPKPAHSLVLRALRQRSLIPQQAHCLAWLFLDSVWSA